MQGNDLTQEEIKNLKSKIKGWFENPHQFNLKVKSSTGSFSTFIIY